MRHMVLRTLAITIGIIMVASAVMLARGQAENAIVTQVYSTGILQDDHSVLYSIIFINGKDPLEKLTITGAIPAEAASAEEISAPVGAHFAADATNVNWQFDKIDGFTILGPFTYRVQFKDAAKPIPANLAAEVNWVVPTPGSVTATVLDKPITTLAQFGKITIDPKGTLDDQGKPHSVPVGDTGIWLFVPAEAVAQPVELRFTRLAVDDSAIPQEINDIWWCAMIKIESDAPVKLVQPILVGLPTRQILTVGMPVLALTRSGDSNPWKPLETTQGLRIAGGGDLAAVLIADTLPSVLVTGVSSGSKSKSSSGTGSNGGFGGQIGQIGQFGGQIGQIGSGVGGQIGTQFGQPGQFGGCGGQIGQFNTGFGGQIGQIGGFNNFNGCH